MTDVGPLIQAIEDGDRALVHELLQKDENAARATTDAGLPLVLYAAYQGDPEIIDLVTRRAGVLDIHSAVALAQEDSVRAVLAADPDQRDRPGGDGYRPLHIAAHFGHRDLLLFLIEQGADLAARSENTLGATPLHSAVANEQTDATRLLLEKQVNVNARQASNVTALHLAALRGNRALVDLLLAFGADPGATNKAGQTALDLAREAPHPNAAERLEHAHQRTAR